MKKSEEKFLEALEKVGLSRSLCESINDIRKAVFENEEESTGDIRDFLAKKAEEDEDKEFEENLIHNRFSNDHDVFVKPRKSEKKIPVKKDTGEKWEKRVELEDPYDLNWRGKKVKIVHGRDKGSIGVIDRVHNSKLYIDTDKYFDLEKDPWEVLAKSE
jgi:hypothetical protein